VLAPNAVTPPATLVYVFVRPVRLDLQGHDPSSCGACKYHVQTGRARGVSFPGSAEEAELPDLEAATAGLDDCVWALTPRLAQTVQRRAKSLFRSLLAVALVARGANRPDVVEQVCDLAGELARTTGCLDARSPAGESTD
jgi:hypothetical protein